MSVCGIRISYLWGLYNIQVVAAGFSTLMKQETDIFARTGFRYRCEAFEIMSNQWNITKEKSPRCTSGQCSQYGQGY